MEKDYQYSIPINNKDKADNESSIYRHPLAVNKPLESFVSLNTLHNAYNKALQKPDLPMLGHRSIDSNGNLSNIFNWFTVKQVFDTAEKIGSGLINLDIVEVNNDWNKYKLKFVGVYSKNSIRYDVFDIACGIYNFTSVPIYDTLGAEATQFAFNQTKMKVCFVTVDHIEDMVKAKKEKDHFKSLENIIVMDYENMPEEWPELFKDTFQIITFDELLKKGQTNIQPWAQITQDDIYCFSYTSGTTGTPKGAMISHKNICSTMCSSEFIISIDSNDVYLSYLPMAHCLERTIFNILIWKNVQIGLFSGNTKLLMEDLQILKPTIFTAVPKILNRIYSGMRKQMNKSYFSGIINNAIQTKIENLHSNTQTNHWIHDKIFFKQARDKLGGRVRLMMTGSAPISQHTMDFLKVAFSAQIIEGYGQTEACAFEFATHVNDGYSGHVGGPIVCNEFKLVDCPDMGYISNSKDAKGNMEPKGELYVRGPNVIPGFFKLDDKNKETFTKDGWLKSGDIAVITQDGNRLKIIDRKKNLFKLSQGEYIAAEKLENSYEDLHSSVNEFFVYGDSHQDCLVAIINIDDTNLEQMAEDFGIKNDDQNDLKNNQELHQKIIEKLNQIADEKNFNNLEKIKGIIIDTKDWKKEGLVTTSMKKKRKDIQDYFKDDIKELYKNL